MSYDSTLISDKTRKRLTLLHARDPLDLIRLDSMRVMFQDEMWNQGYGDAVVDTSVVVDEAEHLADVKLTFTPNHRTVVGRITVSGTHAVAEKIVRHALTFQTGDIFRLSDVLESQRNLYESNLFRLAAIEVPPQAGQHQGRRHRRSPRRRCTKRVWDQASTRSIFSNSRRTTRRTRCFGGARRLDADVTVGNLFAGSLEGKGPFRNVSRDLGDADAVALSAAHVQRRASTSSSRDFLRPSDAIAVGAFSHRTINPGVFIDRGYGGQLTFTHEVRRARR